MQRSSPKASAGIVRSRLARTGWTISTSGGRGALGCQTIAGVAFEVRCVAHDEVLCMLAPQHRRLRRGANGYRISPLGCLRAVIVTRLRAAVAPKLTPLCPRRLAPSPVVELSVSQLTVLCAPGVLDEHHVRGRRALKKQPDDRQARMCAPAETRFSGLRAIHGELSSMRLRDPTASDATALALCAVRRKKP